MKNSFYDFDATLITGEKISMEKFKGKTVLIVNTASKCGFTPQYKSLENLYNTNKDFGLEILGFPCDQFGHQEPGNDAEIKNFCELNFGVTFNLFKKVEVNGKNAHPIYKYLKKELPGILGGKIKWNFTKFLIAPNGVPVKRFAPAVKPENIFSDIKPLLDQVIK